MGKTYSEGWITLPNIGRRWRTKTGEFKLKQPTTTGSNLFENLLNTAQNAYRAADRTLGGWLPGGGTANQLSPAVSQAPQQLRDVVLDRFPRPESLFLKAMTGGAPTQTTMTDREIAAIKGAWEEKQKPLPSAEQLLKKQTDAWNSAYGPASGAIPGLKYPPKPTLEAANLKVLNLLKRQQDPVTSLYEHDRDLKMAYGNLSVYPQSDGGYRIYDRYKIDSFDGPTTPIELDLVEGGKIPTALFRAAQRLGTYKPFDIDVTVSPERWNRIQAIPPGVGEPATSKKLGEYWDERTKREQGPILYQLNQMFGGLLN